MRAAAGPNTLGPENGEAGFWLPLRARRPASGNDGRRRPAEKSCRKNLAGTCSECGAAAAISADQPRLTHHVTLHRRQDGRPRRARRQIELSIQSVQREDIVVRPGRRTRASITEVAEI